MNIIKVYDPLSKENVTVKVLRYNLGHGKRLQVSCNLSFAAEKNRSTPTGKNIQSSTNFEVKKIKKASQKLDRLIYFVPIFHYVRCIKFGISRLFSMTREKICLVKSESCCTERSLCREVLTQHRKIFKACLAIF